MDHKIIVIVWQMGEKIKVTDGPQDNSNCMTNGRENKGFVIQLQLSCGPLVTFIFSPICHTITIILCYVTFYYQFNLRMIRKKIKIIHTC
jgi:hypothetical protein